MKKFLVVLIAAASVFGYAKYKEAEADKAKWNDATDSLDSNGQNS